MVIRPDRTSDTTLTKGSSVQIPPNTVIDITFTVRPEEPSGTGNSSSGEQEDSEAPLKSEPGQNRVDLQESVRAAGGWQRCKRDAGAAGHWARLLLTQALF